MLVCECECVCVSMLTRLRHVEAQRDYARAAQHVDREGQWLAGVGQRSPFFSLSLSLFHSLWFVPIVCLWDHHKHCSCSTLSVSHSCILYVLKALFMPTLYNQTGLYSILCFKLLNDKHNNNILRMKTLSSKISSY